jgi:hypothetical protein
MVMSQQFCGRLLSKDQVACAGGGQGSSLFGLKSVTWSLA